MTMIVLNCLMHSSKIFKIYVNRHFIEFRVDKYVDVDEDVLTLETNVMTDGEITARVTQSHYDTSDDDNGDEEEDVDWEMSPPRKDDIRQAFEVLQSCCLFQDDGNKMRKKVSEVEKM